MVEAGELVSAAYAAKILHDLGADVIKLEATPGDRARLTGPFARGRTGADSGGLFAYLNAGKRAATVDLGDPQDQAYARDLIEGADVFVHNLEPAQVRAAGLRYPDLEDHHALIYSWITPFGQDGPHADWVAEDLTVLAAGGWAYLSPGGGSDAARPPLKPYGHCADFQAGTHAALVTLAALHERERSGRGQSIDISAQACVAAALEGALVRFLYVGELASRLGSWSYAPRCVVQGADGMLFINILEEDQWRRFVELMGAPDWAQAGTFADRASRVAHADALTALIAEWARAQRVDEFYERAGRAGLPCSPVFDAEQIVDSEHLRERRFFRSIAAADGSTITAPGSPFALSGLSPETSEAAPALTDAQRPRFADLEAARLEGRHRPSREAGPDSPPLDTVRILDLSWVWAGPYCTLNLAHLGAEVIRVESRRRLDIQRRLPPFAGGLPGVNRAGLYNQWNQGKRSLTIDFSSSEGQQLIRELAAVSDVVVENFSSGTLDRYGLGWTSLKDVNPRLIMLSLSAFGASGPYRRHVAYGSTQVMMSGLATSSGWPGDPPTDVGLSYGDPNAGLHGAIAILAALRAREQTGRGRWIDLSQWEALLAVLPEGLLHQTMTGEAPQRTGNADPLMAPHGFYRCRGSDRWVSVAVRTDEAWTRLADRLDLARDERLLTLEGRRGHAALIDERLERWTRSRSAWACTSELQAIGIAAFPVMSCEDLATDEQLARRGFFVQLPHAEVDGARHAGASWRLSRSPVGPYSAAPLLGEDTEWAIRQLLGKSAQESERLDRSGALR